MVTLKILDEEFDETIDNISLGCAFSTIEDYCNEHMIDEPKVEDIKHTYTDTIIMHSNNVTFEIEDYPKTKIGKIKYKKSPKIPIILKTNEDFKNILKL